MTQATFLADPDARRVFLADIAVRRRYKAADMTGPDGTYTNCWKVTWPWKHLLPSAVSEFRSGAYYALTERASVSACNTNDNSFFYDEATALLWVNPNGSPSPLTSNFLATYLLRVGTDDLPCTIGGRDVLYRGNMLQEIVINRESAFLDGIVSAGAGRIVLRADEELDLLTRYKQEILIGSTITLWVGGEDHLGNVLTHTGSDGGGAGTTYAKLFTGIITSGINQYGSVEWSGETDQLTLPMSDLMSLYSKTIPFSGTPINGRPDEIINSALTTAGLTTATIETAGNDDLGVGVAAAIPYHCSLCLPEETSIINVLRACMVHLLVFWVDRTGTPRISYWKEPATAGNEVAIINSDYDPTSYRRATDYAKWFSAVTVFLGRGQSGAAQVSQANAQSSTKPTNDGGDKEIAEESFTGSWTQRGSFNVWERAYAKKPVEVYENGVLLEPAGSFNACDTNNLSWAWVTKDDVSSGDPNRLLINPTGSPGNPNSATTIRVKYEKQRDRTSESVSGGKDTNLKTSSNAEASATVGKGKPLIIHGLVTNATDAASMASDVLALVDTPLDTVVIDTTIAEIASIEINDTIRVTDEDGSGEQFRVRGLQEDWGKGRLRITAWRHHEGTVW